MTFRCRVAAFITLSLIAVTTASAQSATSVPPALDAAAAARFAQLALDCVHKEYPNKIAHVLASDADARPPRELTPAFYGCYDWHSAVHGHWLLVRAVRMFPDAPYAERARAELETEAPHAGHGCQRAADFAFFRGAIHGCDAEHRAGGGGVAGRRGRGLGWCVRLTAAARGGGLRLRCGVGSVRVSVSVVVRVVGMLGHGPY